MYFSTKTYVVGTYKNHLNEMVLLSTQSICCGYLKESSQCDASFKHTKTFLMDKKILTALHSKDL